ncbi:MAG: M28 family peptidase [Nannocystaceae bacterium]
MLALAGCTPSEPPPLAYDPASLRFDGDAALARLGRFVADFPDRESGAENNVRAADFLEAELRRRGLACRRDRWTVTNFSRALPLDDVICRLPGGSPREIVVVAHHDQSPETIEGADNDGSGITILLGLAELFAAEGPPAYTLVFLAADGEEWGMLGSRRFVAEHDDPSRILAAISLDNLGKGFYDGLTIEPIGQFRGYGPLWLQRAAETATTAVPGLWVPRLRSILEQVLDQAVPISFMDQGPFVAAGVPALGLAGAVPEGSRELHWQTYHSPGDTMALQSAASLGQAGRAAEALIRQLQGTREFPVESGPYLHDPRRGEALRGAGLWAMFVGVVGLFFVGAARRGGARASSIAASLRRTLPHALALWLPLCGALGVLRLLVATGLMLEFHLYPATPRDPEIFHPRWPAVAIFLAVTAALFVGALRLARRAPAASPGDRQCMGLAMVGLCGAYVLVLNPFSLLFLVPALAWLGIRGRRGIGRALDLGLFALGGAVVYALIWFFGFVILRSGLGVLWYLMMMFAIGMVGLPTGLAITAALAGGLLLVTGAKKRG